MHLLEQLSRRPIRWGRIQLVANVQKTFAFVYENSYDLEYEDGDSETRVPARLIRPLATAAPRDLIPTPLTTTSQAPPPTDVETGGEL